MKKHLPLYIILLILPLFILQVSLPVAFANPYTYKSNDESYKKDERQDKKGHGKKRRRQNMLYKSLSESDKKVFDEIMHDFDKDMRPLRKKLKRTRKELQALYGENGVEDMDAFKRAQQEMITLSNCIIAKRRDTNKLIEEKIGIKLYDYKKMRKNHGLGHGAYSQKCYGGKK